MTPGGVSAQEEVKDARSVCDPAHRRRQQEPIFNLLYRRALAVKVN